MDDGDGGFRLGKKDSSKSSVGAGEVDYRTKVGKALSHNFLNQKPWHPLSYPNQRKKWTAEQTHANRERRTEEVAREFAQEQEFFRQTALFSKKEKVKILWNNLRLKMSIERIYSKYIARNDESKQKETPLPMELPNVDVGPTKNKNPHQDNKDILLKDPSKQEKWKERLEKEQPDVKISWGILPLQSSEVQAVYNAMKRDERMKYFL